MTTINQNPKPDILPGLQTGRTVHYVTADLFHCAAIITDLGQDVALGECELQVAIPQFGWQRVSTAYFDPHMKAPGTWHWIEHVE